MLSDELKNAILNEDFYMTNELLWGANRAV